MDEPLKTWYCDTCGEKIAHPSKGYVIWKNSPERKAHGFKIIHQGKCDQDDHHASSALTDFLGPDGLAKLLSHLSVGPFKGGGRSDVKDLDEYVDFIRRVQSPYYEEARKYFDNHDVAEAYADANEVLPYLQNQLKSIAAENSEK
jgi:hypothetical protein